MNILFYSRHVGRGQGCRIEDTGGGGYSLFGKVLVDHGFNTSSCYYEITKEALENCNILIIAKPSNSKFSKEIEIPVITEFVKNGGGLFLLHDEPGDYGNKTNLNDLSRVFKITFDDGLIGGCKDFKSGWLTRPIIHEFTNHPITEGVKNIWYWGCGVTGGSPIAQVCEMGITKNKAVVIAATEYKDGRVVCIGSPWLFINDERYYSPHYYDEFQLGLNIINWLGEKQNIQIKRFPFRNRWVKYKAFSRMHPDMITFISLLLALYGTFITIIQFL